LELICDIDCNVPRQLLGDPGRIRQILINLMGNAIKFTHTGSITLRVKAEQKTFVHGLEYIDLHFAIEDTGIGIAESKRKLIFEAFSQEDTSTTRQYGGTGLGLTICSRLVELMQGQIWVDSVVTQGSTFHFTLRLKTDPDQIQLEPVDTAYLRGKRVLVVDDIEVNRQIVERQLTKYGMIPECVSGGGAAIKRMHQTDEPAFDLLLLDVQMPDMDGFLLAKTLRDHPPIGGLPPLVFLSSSGMKGDAQQCREIGVAAYFSKPVLEDELIAGIQRVFAPVVNAATAPKESPLVTRYSARENQQPLKVLLVEDHPVNQKLAVGLLTRWGHKTLIAADGQAGVDAFERDSYDVILMDVQMPVMNGLEATRVIRKLELQKGLRRTPIFAMTANAMQGDREECINSGMDEYISKPIKAKELQILLEGIVPREDIGDR
jgi:CheY-like chemotaxis protein